MAKNNKTAKPFVYNSTIWKSVGGGFSNAGESRIFKVGKHKVLVTRAERLDYYGNPIHTAVVVCKDGTVGKACKTNGSATLAVSGALENVGVGTKYKKRKR